MSIDLVYRILYIVDRAGILGIPAILFLHKILYKQKRFWCGYWDGMSILKIGSVIGIIQIAYVKIMEINGLKKVIRELLGKRVYHRYSEYIFEVRRYEDAIYSRRRGRAIRYSI
ncbi:hypothetical protein IK7_06363 [Bacillus cereus VD156]|nr:hypothetical protein IK7_06363 [Bacillus cereus VD156]